MYGISIKYKSFIYLTPPLRKVCTKISFPFSLLDFKRVEFVEKVPAIKYQDTQRVRLKTFIPRLFQLARFTAIMASKYPTPPQIRKLFTIFLIYWLDPFSHWHQLLNQMAGTPKQQTEMNDRAQTSDLFFQ